MTTSPPAEQRETADPPPLAIPLDTFAHRLMLVRAHAGNITIKKAAEMCGLNYGSWSNWERGSKPQDLVDVVNSISEGLGIDADWLMWGGPLEPEARSRPMRTRPHARRRGPLATHQYGRGAERTTPKVVSPGHGPSNRKHGHDRPKGRVGSSAPAPTLRRPVRVGVQ